ATTTSAPSCARRIARDLPMPRLAPVTTATRPRRSGCRDITHQGYHGTVNAQADAAAVGCGYLFHGFGRALWSVGVGAGLRLQAGARPPVPYTVDLEFARWIDGRGTCGCHAGRGRFLCVGAPRHGTVLGISRGLAFARVERVRFGGLPYGFCPDVGQNLAAGDTGTQWRGDCGHGNCRMYALEFIWSKSCRQWIDFAGCSAAESLCADHGICAFRSRNAGGKHGGHAAGT